MDWLAFAREVGFPIASLVLILWAGHRRYWVFGATYQALEARCARQEAELSKLHDLLLRQSSLMARSVQVAEQSLAETGPP